MSKKGCAADNAAVKVCSAPPRMKMFYGRPWGGVRLGEFMDTLSEYPRWYNQTRIKMSLGGMSPLEYRNRLGWAV